MFSYCSDFTSGAGTYLKVGGTSPKQTWGHRLAPENFFGRAPPLFGSNSTISRFGERFRTGRYSMVSFLLMFFYSRCPPRAQPFVKVGARAPPCPMDSASLLGQRASGTAWSASIVAPS